ncbi:MAG: helix-turn-helix domain-containing protein [Oscillospiraceae bacterium]
MNKITQDMRFKQAAIEYSLKHGVTKAAIRYKTSRQNIYRWRKKYDGSIQSLADRSHRPHSHPKQHTDGELKLIQNMRRRNPNTGLVVFWVKLAPARLLQIHLRTLPCPAPNRWYGCEASKSEVYPKTLRKNDISRPTGAN